LHHFAVILDPLSEQAQRYTSLFEVIIPNYPLTSIKTSILNSGFLIFQLSL
jgi:hypothetical protein